MSKITKEDVIKQIKDAEINFKDLDDEFKKDKEIASLSIEYQGGMQLQYADNSLKKDKDFILQVMQLSAYLEYVDDSLKKDKDVVIEAIKYDPNNIDFADDSLKEDEDIKKLLEKM